MKCWKFLRGHSRAGRALTHVVVVVSGIANMQKIALAR
jgi:hypothetical protein